MTELKMPLADIGQLSRDALVAAGSSKRNAAAVARSVMLAERDGIRSHGLLYVPIYAEHVRCGKVDGLAEPVVTQSRPGAITVDARRGFAHPAIDAGWDCFMESARFNGVAVMTIAESYNCGVLGHHAERIAEDRMLGLCMTHAPASIAPPGGHRPVIGTNPFALAVPGAGPGDVAFTVDQSASVIAKSEVMLRSRTGKLLEPGWAIDKDGQPTVDPAAALSGSMLPFGGYKGFGVGLMVEILASCLSGAVLSQDASPFSGTAGGPPRTGQCFIAFAPDAFAPGFGARVETLVKSICDQPGTHIPGSRRSANRARHEQDNVTVDRELITRIRTLLD